jgi:hypothetical protein
MLIAALFTIARYGNSQDALQVLNGLRKWYLYKMEFYSAIIKNKILLFSGQ